MEDVVWEILFGEAPERIPNPNLPENTAHLNAKQKQEKERLRHFIEGQGKVLFERWKKQIRTDVMKLFGKVDNNCNCEVCWEIRKIRNIFELILEAETIINQG